MTGYDHSFLRWGDPEQFSWLGMFPKQRPPGKVKKSLGLLVGETLALPFASGYDGHGVVLLCPMGINNFNA